MANSAATRQVVPQRQVRQEPVKARTLAQQLGANLIGQPQALERILPYVSMYKLGLHTPDRPVGIFLLLGPTGTGKTKSCEVLAEALHGSPRSLLKINCGEFQMEHEVAKLIGAPPGYLGHRETQPMLTQAKLSAVTSENSNLSIVLFDEIEKAAPSMNRLLLGVLDKATLRLGDNSTVNFDRSLIFMTSNLGADAMKRELAPDFGFETMVVQDREPSTELMTKLNAIGTAAVKRKFSPEFVNRIDEIVTYNPLNSLDMVTILELELTEVQKHIDRALEGRPLTLRVTQAAKDWLLLKGTSKLYGARELKRVLTRSLRQPLAVWIEDHDDYKDVVVVGVGEDGLTFA